MVCMVAPPPAPEKAPAKALPLPSAVIWKPAFWGVELVRVTDTTMGYCCPGLMVAGKPVMVTLPEAPPPEWQEAQVWPEGGAPVYPLGGLLLLDKNRRPASKVQNRP